MYDSFDLFLIYLYILSKKTICYQEHFKQT